MAETGRLICTSMFDDDNGKTVNVTGTSTAYSAVGVITGRQAVFEVPTKEKYLVEVIAEITKSVLVTPADPGDPGSTDVYEDVTEEVVEFSQTVVMCDCGYAELNIGLRKDDWRGVKNIVRAHLETQYFNIGDEVDMTLLDHTHHPMLVAAIDHDEEYPHQVIFVSKYLLPYQRQLHYLQATYVPWSGKNLCHELNGGVFWSLLPDEAKEVISIRRFKNCAAANNNALTDVESKIWLPREREVLPTCVKSATLEATACNQFPLFVDQSNRAKRLGENGEAALWATVTPMCGGSYPYITTKIKADGSGVADSTYDNSIMGVLPCFHVTDE